MLMKQAVMVSKVLMWQGLYFFFLQLNYSRNYALVASALAQIQLIDGDDICLS